MMANVKTAPAKKGLFWPTKEAPDQKIDGPVAMIMAVARAMTGDDVGDFFNALSNQVTS
jgi:phage terminase large subunit-like protein